MYYWGFFLSDALHQRLSFLFYQANITKSRHMYIYAVATNNFNP